MKSVPVVLAMLVVLYSLLMLLVANSRAIQAWPTIRKEFRRWCWDLSLSGEARCLTVRPRDYKVALRKSRLAYNVPWIFVFPKGHKFGFPQMTVWGPLGKIYLRDRVRTKPSAIFHFFSRERPRCALLFRQVSKRTISGL